MLALAACANGSGTSEGGGNGSETDGSSGGGTGSSPSSTNGANSGSGETTLTALADVEVGAAKAVTLPNGAPAVVARPTTATAVCFSAVCTHQGCTVAPSGAKLVCPCHGSEFNALTGAVLQGPAASPLPKVAVKVQAGKVVTA
jgi:Rieske Fe-S protein